MCLVNMAKNYYYLRRVSDDGSNETDADNTNEWFIGGTEMSDNYVVDYDWSAKRTVGGIKASNEKDYFNFPLYTDDVKNADAGGETTGYAYNRFGWYTDRIQEDFLDKDPSNDTWTNPSTGSGYKIWRYVTENTIPATAKGADGSDGTTDQQKTVQSTGIVFKGRIVAGRDIEEDTDHKYMSEKVKDAITAINVDGFGKGIAKYEDLEDEDREKIPYLYSYNNILYAGHEELIERANADGNNGPLHHVANEILAHWVLVEKPDDFTVTHTPKNGTVTKVYIYKEKPASGDESMTVEAWAKINKKDSDGKAEPEYFLVKDEDGKEVQEYRDYEIDMDHFLSLAPLSDVVVYRPYNEDEKDINGQSMGDGWGYYCYYFYWNRHNDNGKGGLMGPMEFATVRNNVYKLAVTNINKLGHPRNTDHDPDPLTPETPDEDPTNYIQVQVNVLPWVVRVNNIEF
ncbi:MAG: Mfa1 fimbrilin C-terminal domain-containing protein [Muribaculaceae bacterium]|nr:Mfa1 fimbrilin C-terminal domain-containing protein [Muribaculaceae bacterium]